MSVIIGLTGGIGSGKSTVSEFFQALNVCVVDADIIARSVVAKDSPVLTEINQYFGGDLLIDGQLNRAKLRDIIFTEPAKKRWLNNLLHPLIRAEMLSQLSQASGHYVLLEAPLLFENKLEQYCQKVIVVDVDETLQIKRASLRDNSSESQIKAIIESQISRSQRLSKADYIIDNNGVSLAALESSVIALDKQLQKV